MIGAFYDGVFLLGMALNETLSEGGDIRDGAGITKRMWSRDFHGKVILILYFFFTDFAIYKFLLTYKNSNNN